MNKFKLSILFVLVAFIIAGVLLVGIWLFATGYFFNKNVVYLVPTEVKESPQVLDEVVKGSNMNTYVNHTYGFEFTYPTDFILDNHNYGSSVSLDLHSSDYKNRAWISFANVSSSLPDGMSPQEWIVRDLPTEEYSGGQFSNKKAPSIDIDGVSVFHFASHTTQGGTFDNFYFIKNNHLFQISIAGRQEEVPGVPDQIILHNLDLTTNNWATAFLKSFKFKK